MLTAQKEFIVTLKDYRFLDEFYLDMETPGTTKSFVPNRSVECINRRPVSRNTHYLLLDDEARLLTQDPRVDAVSLKIDIDTVKPRSNSQTSDWNRSLTIQPGEKNYGLYRCQLNQNVVSWGSDSGTTTQNATINLTGTGKHVDVVIVDETVWPSHPEYSTRFVAYDWFANHNSVVWPANLNANYVYDTFSTVNNHATHVAAIIAGSTQGWAREANIYNIKHDVQGEGSFIPHELLIDYIRQFHANKPVNPQTGRKNPTIVNNSWGFEYTNNELNPYPDFQNPTKSIISQIVYRGSTVAGAAPATDTGFSGIFTNAASIANMSNMAANSGNRIVTTGISTGTVTSTTFTNTNRVGLTQLGAPTASDPLGVGSLDDAYWQLNLPFPITYLTQSYQNNIYLSSNSYITLGSGTFDFYLTPVSPNIRKIGVSGGDRAASSIWTGTFGISPNRTFVVRYEGYEGAYSPTYEVTPTLVWEVKFYETPSNQIDLHIIQNSVYRPEYTSSELENYGVKFNIGSSPVRNTFIDADILDAINEGIIFVGSAGNNGTKIDLSTGNDYNNYFIDNGLRIYYHQGNSPGASHPDVICVGNLDSSGSENKNVESNTGPRVDVYAPGTNITSAVFDKFGNFANDIVGSIHLTINGGFAGLSSVLAQAGRAAISTVEAHGLTNGDIITIDNCSNAEYNVTNEVVSVVDADTFSFNISNTGYTNVLEILTGTVKVGGLTQKWSGSSMSAAQVTGLVILALEQYPWMTQADAKEYVLSYAKENLMFTTAGSYNDSTSLQDGNNKIAFHYKERPDSGMLIPKVKQWLRPISGQVYPRPKIKRT